MGLDERYPDSATLTFKPDPLLDRFWVVPPQPEPGHTSSRPFWTFWTNGGPVYHRADLGSWPKARTLNV